MKTKLVYDLWRDPPFRSALKKEALHFLLGVAVGLSIAAFVRWYLGWSFSRDGMISTVIGVITLVLFWLVSVVRTVRAVLREHLLLAR
jgi:hypothetical protein